jgi:hypothetical protein
VALGVGSLFRTDSCEYYRQSISQGQLSHIVTFGKAHNLLCRMPYSDVNVSLKSLVRVLGLNLAQQIVVALARVLNDIRQVIGITLLELEGLGKWSISYVRNRQSLASRRAVILLRKRRHTTRPCSVTAVASLYPRPGYGAGGLKTRTNLELVDLSQATQQRGDRQSLSEHGKGHDRKGDRDDRVVVREFVWECQGQSQR